MNVLKCWLLLSLLTASEMGFAQTSSGSQGPDIRVRRMQVDIEVRQDGTFTETVDTLEQLNSSRAVRDSGQRKVPFSSSLDDLQIVKAYTLKKDGQKIPVSSSSIFTQDGLISETGLTSFQDIKTIVLVFPYLEPGDSIALVTKRVRKKTMLPGVFSYTQIFPDGFVIDDSTVTISYPRSMPLNVESVALQELPQQAKGDQLIRAWSFKNSRAAWPEDYTVHPIMYRPRILVSTLKNYAELASAAGQRFVGKAEVTTRIRQTALEITRDAKTPSEKATLIHEWVSRNIRYFSIVLDLGGYVPRKAEEVLVSRFGDCKDHTVLMQALLAAVGISSQAALLSTDPIYELPRIPVLSAFNHVIAYVPSLDVFLETTTPNIAYGVLPDSDADKPVVLLNSAIVDMRTPKISSASSPRVLISRIAVAPDGSASGQDVLTALGANAVYYTGLGDAVLAGDPIRLAKGFILQAGLAGDGTVAFVPYSNKSPFRFTMLYELKEFWLSGQAGSLRVLSPMSFMWPESRSQVSGPPKRTVPYTCFSKDEIEKFEITFPAGLRIRVPQGKSITIGNRSFKSSYSLRGSTVTVERRFLSNLPKSVCQPEEHQDVLKISEMMLRDMRSEIHYVPAVLNESPVSNKSADQAQ